MAIFSLRKIRSIGIVTVQVLVLKSCTIHDIRGLVSQAGLLVLVLRVLEHGPNLGIPGQQQIKVNKANLSLKKNNSAPGWSLPKWNFNGFKQWGKQRHSKWQLLANWKSNGNKSSAWESRASDEPVRDACQRSPGGRWTLLETNLPWPGHWPKVLEFPMHSNGKGCSWCN